MRVYTDLTQLPLFRNAVVTIGSFDGVHLGHRTILEQVKQLARQINGESVVITFDPHPRTVLKPEDHQFKLLSSTPEKVALLEASGIDHVVVAPFSPDFAQQSASAYVSDFLVHYFQPKYIVIGYDHRFGNRREGDIAFLKNLAGTFHYEVMEIPAQVIDDLAISSSKIRKALEAADVQQANRLLGHPYAFSGKVIKGDQVGRTLGFPTANIEIEDPYKLIPPPGIYAAKAKLPNGNLHTAALYIGNRPTIGAGGRNVIEVNIFDFDGDLYGQALQVEVLDFVREDRRLESLSALQAQIEADRQAIQRRWPSKPVDAAIVILNYNTRQHLLQFLPTVLAHAQGARVIVADNGSPDDSLEVLRSQFPTVEIIDLKQNYGFAQGYNEALRQVEAEFYVILNSDVAVTAGWMAPVLEAMQQDERLAVAQPKILQWAPGNSPDQVRFEHAGAAGGWIDTLGYPFCRGRIFSHREVDHGQYDTAQSCFWAAGAAFFIRASLFRQFGGFDGDYFAHNEEIDLCWRLKRAGYSVACIPQSVVYHLGGGTLEYESPRKVFLNFRNSLFSLVKNEPWLKLCWLLPARFLLDGLAGARFLAKGQFQAIWAIVRAHFSFYGALGETIRKRKLTEALVRQHRIGPASQEGIYRGSIIFAHYLRRVKRFSELPAVLLRTKT